MNSESRSRRDKLAQQVADVGPDAEVVELSRVDANPHRAIITGQEGRVGQEGQLVDEGREGR